MSITWVPGTFETAVRYATSEPDDPAERMQREGFVSSDALWGIDPRTSWGEVRWHITHLMTGLAIPADSDNLVESMSLLEATVLCATLSAEPDLWKGGAFGEAPEWARPGTRQAEAVAAARKAVFG